MAWLARVGWIGPRPGVAQARSDPSDPSNPVAQTVAGSDMGTAGLVGLSWVRQDRIPARPSRVRASWRRSGMTIAGISGPPPGRFVCRGKAEQLPPLPARARCPRELAPQRPHRAAVPAFSNGIDILATIPRKGGTDRFGLRSKPRREITIGRLAGLGGSLQ